MEPDVLGQFRPGDTRDCYPDISLARALLGYEPQVTFQQGAAELVEWVRQQQGKVEDRFEQAQQELREHGLAGSRRLSRRPPRRGRVTLSRPLSPARWPPCGRWRRAARRPGRCWPGRPTTPRRACPGAGSTSARASLFSSATERVAIAARVSAACSGVPAPATPWIASSTSRGSGAS